MVRKQNFNLAKLVFAIYMFPAEEKRGQSRWRKTQDDDTASSSCVPFLYPSFSLAVNTAAIFL